MTYYYEYEVKTVDLSSYAKARDSAWKALNGEMKAYCLKNEDQVYSLSRGTVGGLALGGLFIVITIVVDERGALVDDFANYLLNPFNDSPLATFWRRGEEIWDNFDRECSDARESKLGGAIASAIEWKEKQIEMWINQTREQSACRDAIKEIERHINEKENAKKKAEKEKKKLQEQKKEVGLEGWRTDAEKSFYTNYLDSKISIIEATIDVYDAQIERLKVEKEDWQLQLNRAESDPYGGIRETVQSLLDELRDLQAYEEYLKEEARYLESIGLEPDWEERGKAAREREKRIPEIYEQIEKLTKPISEKVESEDAELASKYKEASDKINLMEEMLRKASERADEILQNSKQPEKQKTKREEEREKMSALYNKYFEALEKAATNFGDRMQADSLSMINELASQMASSFNGKD